MKNVVKLTADELATVLDTIEATAIAQTLRETPTADAAKTFNSINWQGVFSVLFEMFDNGLTAMGIEIAEEIEAMDEDEGEGEEVDDFGLPMDYWSEFDEDEEEGEDDEEEEKEPERVDLDLNKPLSQCVFIYEGQRAIKQSDANQIAQAIMKAIENRLGFLPEEIKQQMCTEMLLKILKDNGVEIMVKGK